MFITDIQNFLKCSMNVIKFIWKEENLKLTNLEIHERIDRNNKIIEDCFSPNVFTLNNTVRELLKENEELQHQCSHEFQDGYCIYCYKEKE